MSHQKLVRVREVMKTNFDLVDGLSTVADVLKEMEHADDTKSLIVQKRNDDDEYGIVTLTDIATKVLAKDKAPDRVNIYEIMTKPIIPIDPEMDIRYCARLFENFGLTRAPVIEQREIIGIVSYTDLVIQGMKAQL